MGLKTAGIQQDAKMGGISSPLSKYSDLPFLISVATMVIGFFNASNEFSGICFSKISRRPSRLNRPVIAHAGRMDRNTLAPTTMSRIFSGLYPYAYREPTIEPALAPARQ